MNSNRFFARTLPATLAALALAGAASVSFAQTDASAPKTRQDVKADAKASTQAGTAVGGQQSTPTQAKGGMADANTTGTPTSPTATTGSMASGKSPMAAASRAEVRTDAAAANKAGTNPKGELSTKDQDKGGAKGVKP